MQDRIAVVLAAGKGTRMKSDLPKVLVPACGRPIIQYVLDALQRTGHSRVVVVIGYRGDDVRQALAARQQPDFQLQFVEQREQRGTGHAVLVCREALDSFDGPVTVLTGDSPMVQDQSLRQLLQAFEQQQAACLLGTLHHPRPTGLGRIVRDPQSGEFLGIVEEKDASEAQRAITEVNMSTYVFDNRDLFWALDRVGVQNRQAEMYLTDCPGILKQAGKRVAALPVLSACEALSINTVEDLQHVETQMRKMGYNSDSSRPPFRQH
jgi:bifunctional UDP-N-acetylglucosamine pyrophosphorylase / glucosamine-1-phosphate N-acetyltransferase